jgi:glycosyltransferase involved in cell wall biosynthesis
MGSHTAPRLLIVVHSAKLAGAQLVALGQAEDLASDHELVIAIGRGPLRNRFAPLGRLIRAPTRAPIWGASRSRWLIDLTRAIPDAIRLAVVARRRRVSAIVANSTVLVAPVLAAHLARVPVLVCAHEAPTSRAARRLFRFHAALADTVIAISPWIAEAFASSRSRVVISPPGISIPRWQDRPPRRTDTPALLLVVGTIDSHKRQDVAIAALAKLREAGVAVGLEIVGREADQAYAARLKQMVRDLGLGDYVRFAGESSDVLGRLRAADAVLVPAGEVTPLVLMESMAVGTPVVAARMGSIPDVVIDGATGLLVDPDDAGAMAEAVRLLLEDPARWIALSNAGRERVEKLFDRARYHQTLREELERLAASNGRGGASVAGLARA